MGITDKVSEKYVKHYDGLTRRLLDKNDINSNKLLDVEKHLIRKMKVKYNFSYENFIEVGNEEINK